jgi:hypothetical protein
MRRIRVSIAGLMAVVVFVAVGVAALRQASEIWAGILFALTLVMIGFAMLRAAYRTGPARASWAGFALFGSGYLAVVFLPGSESRPPLGTTLALGWLHGKLVPRQQTMTYTAFRPGGLVKLSPVQTAGTNLDWPQSALAASDGSMIVTGSQLVIQSALWTPNQQDLQQVGHCLLALLVGIVGGLVGRWQQAGGLRVAERVPPGPMTTDKEAPCPSAAP